MLSLLLCWCCHCSTAGSAEVAADTCMGLHCDWCGTYLAALTWKHSCQCSTHVQIQFWLTWTLTTIYSAFMKSQALSSAGMLLAGTGTTVLERAYGCHVTGNSFSHLEYVRTFEGQCCLFMLATCLLNLRPQVSSRPTRLMSTSS